MKDWYVRLNFLWNFSNTLTSACSIFSWKFRSKRTIKNKTVKMKKFFIYFLLCCLMAISSISWFMLLFSRIMLLYLRFFSPGDVSIGNFWKDFEICLWSFGYLNRLSFELGSSICWRSSSSSDCDWEFDSIYCIERSFGLSS